eukprot:CAMPEP_0174344360 /NCGR_PEP_ID=MMETSP0810-20121108/27613_1 /TAXON_ID=73025 ORGANISM="Eutreptiella gymnastica-like, Strain CCMP1594" /NCGR_SAMPLE_ID=MMETSP0810 /ASSEMBLY_ACC=CAM_ASM_000659 /LENGTH=169 /DNA_ID=CAMNT_0015467477 /DNA_START=1093 /DNA_END=1602 /DNA_ORIENTATION=-
MPVARAQGACGVKRPSYHTPRLRTEAEVGPRPRRRLLLRERQRGQLLRLQPREVLHALHWLVVREHIERIMAPPIHENVRHRGASQRHDVAEDGPAPITGGRANQVVRLDCEHEIGDGVARLLPVPKLPSPQRQGQAQGRAGGVGEVKGPARVLPRQHRPDCLRGLRGQ